MRVLVCLFAARTTVHVQRTHSVVVRIYKWRMCVCWFVCLLPVLPYTFNVHIRWLYAFINGECAFVGLFVAMRPVPTLRARAHRDGYGDIAYAPNPAKKMRDKVATVRKRRHCVCARPRKKYVTKSRRYGNVDIAYAPNPA